MDLVKCKGRGRNRDTEVPVFPLHSPTALFLSSDRMEHGTIGQIVRRDLLDLFSPSGNVFLKAIQSKIADAPLPPLGEEEGLTQFNPVVLFNLRLVRWWRRDAASEREKDIRIGETISSSSLSLSSKYTHSLRSNRHEASHRLFCCCVVLRPGKQGLEFFFFSLFSRPEAEE